MSESFEFWPSDLSDDLPESPLSILRKAASELGRATRGSIEAEIIFDETYSSERSTRYDFVIISRALNFRYELFSVMIDPILLYPVEIWASQSYKADDSDALTARVRQLTLSSETIRVVKSLMAQSGAA